MNEWESAYAEARRKQALLDAAEAEARRKQALLDAAPRMLEALELVEMAFYHHVDDAVVTSPDGERINLSALIREARGET